MKNASRASTASQTPLAKEFFALLKTKTQREGAEINGVSESTVRTLQKRYGDTEPKHGLSTGNCNCERHHKDGTLRGSNQMGEIQADVLSSQAARPS